MHETNMKSMDLNLLIALKALLEEKHVSRAAERVNLSQPAMSRALGRLRESFQDPLLVKGVGGMSLTARAIALYDPLQNILREISHILTPPSLDLATMQGNIVIATRDYELATILPKVISQTTLKAPNLTLSIVPLIGDDLSPLEHHNVDFVLAGTDKVSASLHRTTLYKESFICLVSKNNPITKQKMDLDTYIKMKHCFVTITSFGVGYVDTLLAQKNLKRNIVVRVPHFLAASHIVADSDLIVTLPRRLGELLSKHENITLIDPPLNTPQFPIFLYWHTRNQDSLIHKWLRNAIKDSLLLPAEVAA